MESGIYAIKSKATDLIYIGGSTQIKRRWKRHLYDLKKNTHHSHLLQAVYNKHSIEDLYFYILERCSPDQVKNLEQTYLDSVDFSKTFNICKSSTFGDVITSHPRRNEIIQQIKSTLNSMYANMSDEEKKIKYGRSLYRNGNWKSGVMTTKTTCECGNFKSYSAKKCNSCYEKSGIKNPFYGKNHSKEMKEKLRKANTGKRPVNAKKVIINGKVYNSASEAARDLGCVTATILNRINNNWEGYSLLDYNPHATIKDDVAI